MIQIGAPAASIDSPLEHLMACHRRIEQRLETLVNAADHLADDRTGALEAIRKSIEFLTSNGALHTEDEEASLFPRLKAKLSTSEIAFLDSLEAQHIEAGSIFSQLQSLIAALNGTSTPAVDVVHAYRACAEKLRALYRDHIRSEDEILTALAKRSLGKSELADISREMRALRAKS